MYLGRAAARAFPSLSERREHNNMEGDKELATIAT